MSPVERSRLAAWSRSTASCRRPGCPGISSVSISYDASACQVFLDPLDASLAGGQPLCELHARGLRAPRGWIIVDRRTLQSRLVGAGGMGVAEADAASASVTGSAPRPSSRRPRPARGWGQFAERGLTLNFSGAPSAEPPVGSTVLESSESVVAAPVETPVEPEVVSPSRPAPLAGESLPPQPTAPMAPWPVQEVGKAPALEPTVSPVVEAVQVTVEPIVPPVVETVHPAEPPTRNDDRADPDPAEGDRSPVVRGRPAPARKRSSTPKKGRPKGRLLARAFDMTGDQRSVLTDPLGLGGGANTDDGGELG
ncbi:MAG: DUF3499 family protein [Microthrixaceae bacterium]